MRKNSLLIGIRITSGLVQWSQGGVDVSFNASVSGEILLRTNDDNQADNSRGWDVTIHVTAPDRVLLSSGLLSIDRIELVQSLQRLNNTVKLIARKRTLVRVFADSGRNDGLNGNRLSNITGTLEVTYPDGTVTTLTPINNADAWPSGSHNRNNLDHSVNFIIPANIPAANLSLRACLRQASSPAGTCEAEASYTAFFENGPRIGILPIIMHISFYDPPPTESQVTDILHAVRQRLPYSENNTSFHMLPFWHLAYGFGLGDWEGWRRLLYDFANKPYFPSVPTPDNLEVVRCAFVSHSPEFDTVGLAGMGIYRPFVPNPSCISVVGNGFAFDVDSCTHEIGHALGLNHSRCMTSTPSPFSPWLPRLTEEPAWLERENRMLPTGTGDMMGYCNPRWPSITAYNYFYHNRRHIL